MTERLRTMRVASAVALAAGVLMLAGCGGGGGSDGGPTNIGDSGGSGGSGGTSGGTLPATALQNSDGFIAYVKQVVANKLDSSEPIDLGGAVAPTSNTAEAVGL